MVGLTLGAFLIKERVHGLILRHQAKIDRHDLVQRLAQMRGTAFGGGIAFGIHLAGLMDRRVYPSESHNGASAWIVAHITDLGHELSGRHVPDTIDGVNRLVLRKLCCYSFIAVSSLAAVWISSLVLSFFGRVKMCIRDSMTCFGIFSKAHNCKGFAVHISSFP